MERVIPAAGAVVKCHRCDDSGLISNLLDRHGGGVPYCGCSSGEALRGNMFVSQMLIAVASAVGFAIFFAFMS